MSVKPTSCPQVTFASLSFQPQQKHKWKKHKQRSRDRSRKTGKLATLIEERQSELTVKQLGQLRKTGHVQTKTTGKRKRKLTKRLRHAERDAMRMEGNRIFLNFWLGNFVSNLSILKSKICWKKIR